MRCSSESQRGHLGLNQGPLDLHSNTLSLSYISFCQELIEQINTFIAGATFFLLDCCNTLHDIIRRLRRISLTLRLKCSHSNIIKQGKKSLAFQHRNLFSLNPYRFKAATHYLRQYMIFMSLSCFVLIYDMRSRESLLNFRSVHNQTW